MADSLLSAETAGGIAGFGAIMQGAGAISSAIGAFYAARAQRYTARSARLNLEFQGTIADINARAAEQDAQFLIESGQLEKLKSTLQFGAAKATARTRRAASGLQAGVGSAAEVQASIEAVKEIDSLTIDKNSLRAAGAARTRAVNFRNVALMSRVSALNVADSARSLRPGMAAFTSLLGSTGSFATSLASLNRL